MGCRFRRPFHVHILMTSPPTTPLTDAEITHLESLLVSPGFAKQSMSLAEIQGFLCAVICGPAAVKPGQWLASVLGNPAWLGAAQESAVKSLLTRFHGEIATDLAAGDPPLLVLNYAGDGADDNYDYAAWCQAFLDGVESSPVAWNDIVQGADEEEELNELLFPISLLAGDIDPKAFKSLKPHEMAGLIKECEDDLPTLVVEIHAWFEPRRGRPPKKTAGASTAPKRTDARRPPAKVGKKKP